MLLHCFKRTIQSSIYATQCYSHKKMYVDKCSNARAMLHSAIVLSVDSSIYFTWATPLPSALFELDADMSVFIYLFSFLRYKLKRECVATQTRFLTSGGDNSSTRKLKHKMTYRQKATCLCSAMKLIIFS